MAITYGVHSEAGTLRRVMVHRPGLEMARLTPENREELLFDDVIWVKQARVEHMTFILAIRQSSTMRPRLKPSKTFSGASRQSSMLSAR